MGSEDQTLLSDALTTVAEGTLLLVGGRIVRLPIIFITELVMARLLGTTNYGGVVVGLTVVSIGMIIGSFGVDTGFQRKLPYYEDEPPKARGVLRAGLAIGLCGGILFGTGLFLLAPTVATVVFDNRRLVGLFRIAAFAIPFAVSTQIGISVARASRNASTFVGVRQILDPISRFVLISAFVLAGFGALGAMAGVAATMVLTGVLALVLGVRSFRISLSGKAEQMYREVGLFSIPLMLSSSTFFVIKNADTLLIEVFLASGAVGLYNAAFRLRQLGLIFYLPMNFLLPSVFSKLDKNAADKEIKRTYQIVSKWVVLITTPVVLGMLFFPETIITITFGPDYTPAGNELRILVVPVLVSALAGANASSVVALGHNKLRMYTDVAAAGLNVILNLFLIPQIGITGAAIASAVAFVGRNVVFGSVLYWQYSVHPFSKAMMKPTGLTLLLAPTMYVTFSHIIPITTTNVVAFGILGIIMYLMLVVIVGGIEPEDKLILDELLSLVKDSL